MTATVLKRGSALALADRRLHQAERVIDNWTGDLVGLKVANVVATGLTRGFATIRNDSRGGRIVGVHAEAAAKSSDPTNYNTGLAFDDRASDWQVVDSVFRGFGQAWDPVRYANGDGVATEVGNSRIALARVRVEAATDAGFDLKGSLGSLRDCWVIGEKGRSRFGGRDWSGQSWGAFFVRHVSAAMNVCIAAEHTTPRVVVIEHLDARGCDHAFKVQTKGTIPPRIVVKSYSFEGLTGPWLDRVEGPAPIWEFGPQGAPR